MASAARPVIGVLESGSEMNNTTLLIMATGIGSCFGKGIKQLEPVLKTNDTWYGMTYNEDVAAVKDVLRENSCPPKEMSLLYWIYLYSAVVILRDVSVTPNGMKYKFPKGVISIVNSFPAAYIISTDKETCGLCDLFDMCSENIDEIVEIVIDLNSCYFAGSKHYRPMLWPCNVDSNEDGAAFLLGYDKVMEASKLAVHSEDSIKKIRARLSSGKR